MLLPPLPGMQTFGMGLAGMAATGAFAAGVALGAAGAGATIGAACLARRMMRERGRWRDEDSLQGMPGPSGPLPGDDSPLPPVGEAPVA